MLNSSIKKYKIVLEYNLITHNIEIEPYRQIKNIRERVIKLFHGIKNDIILKYNNKDLTPNENVTLGEYFKNKTKLILKIIDSNKSNKEYTPIPKPENENVDCSCSKSNVKNYCRSCNEFICENCKFNVNLL
jgi:hypothetical protein